MLIRIFYIVRLTVGPGSISIREGLPKHLWAALYVLFLPGWFPFPSFRMLIHGVRSFLIRPVPFSIGVGLLYSVTLQRYSRCSPLPPSLAGPVLAFLVFVHNFGNILQTLIGEIREKIKNLVTINCDNQGAIALSKDINFHACTKHIDIRYHFIRESVGDGKIQVNYIPTDENPSDIFTKPLAKAKCRCFSEMLGLRGT